jgi:hypothetical protein
MAEESSTRVIQKNVASATRRTRGRPDSINAFCRRCRHEQTFIRAQVRHEFHLLLTVLTLGLWLISWISVIIGGALRPWRCKHCGWHIPEFPGGRKKT